MEIRSKSRLDHTIAGAMSVATLRTGNDKGAADRQGAEHHQSASDVFVGGRPHAKIAANTVVSVPRAERNQAQAADHLSATQAFGGTSDETVLV